MSRSIRVSRPLSGCRAALLTSTVLMSAGAAHAGGTIVTGTTSVGGTQNGNSAGGYFVESGTLTVAHATLEDFTTTGGAGSGGGAGLGGAIFVGTGATAIVSDVTFFNNTVVGGTGGNGSTTGGTLDNILAAPASGSTGASGTEFQDNQYLFGDGDGDGVAGTNGKDGGAAIDGIGGSGGAGGTGSDGWSKNPLLTSQADQADAAEASATAHLAADTAEALVTSANPFTTVNGAAMAATVAADTVDEADATANDVQVNEALTAWKKALSLGEYGNGGDGGQGGLGGSGSWGFGGGAGGNGGAAGLAGASASANGVGGAGGAGGTGGFGGGGGQGGDGNNDASDGSAALEAGAAGTGGTAGFGGGVGSTGSGAGVGKVLGGGGGSGYGGAIFVEAGGTLKITGSATFTQDNVVGGGSDNGGTAGQAAGSDLFMMTGSNVILEPGAGNTIVFNGSIADDSATSISNSQQTGTGAGLTIENGKVVFNGTDTYTGVTNLAGGVLEAIDGFGVNKNSNIEFDGGIFESNGLINRGVGTTSDDVQWTGSGGFAAIGTTLDVDLQNGQTLTWNENSFVPTNSALEFGAADADSNVVFANAVNLNGGDRQIIVIDNAGNTDGAIMAGVLYNGALTVGDGNADGTLFLAAINTYTGTTTIENGANLALMQGASIANSSSVIVDGLLDTSATGHTSLVSLAGDGTVNIGSSSLTLSNAADDFAGSITGTGGVEIAAGTETLSGVNTYTGTTTIDPDADLILTTGNAILASSDVVNNGLLDVSQLINADEKPYAAITTLSGNGRVNLGADTLVFTNAASTFAGSIEGQGKLEAFGGTETLTGTNTYTGDTLIAPKGTLALAGTGSVATSDRVFDDGGFDISATTGGASITTLTGDGGVSLGAETLTLTNAADMFAGTIEGTGDLEVANGIETLTGTNTYTGTTTVDPNATLALSGSGSVAPSSVVNDNGVFDISASTGPAPITSLAGGGTLNLGAQTLQVTHGADTFAGVVEGLGNLEIVGGAETLTGSNTYKGVTVIDTKGTLALADRGTIASSEGVLDNGVFDISALGDLESAKITTLAGDGVVALGTKTLVLDEAANTFAGEIEGTGRFGVEVGTETLTGNNTFTGETGIGKGATLALAGAGSIARSAAVLDDGLLDISTTKAGAAIRTLTGDGEVNFGARTLTLTAAADTFAGVAGGTGGLTVAGGTETLTGTNSYTGATTIDPGAALALTGTGSIARSSRVLADGTLDISGTKIGAAVTTLAGDGLVKLGAETLALTKAADTFEGIVSGTGNFEVAAGSETLTGTNAYTGATAIDGGATLALSGTGAIATSSVVDDNGVFDLSAASGRASVTSLAGSGVVALGDNTLVVTAGGSRFDGKIEGVGALELAGGIETLGGTNAYTGATIIDAGATLALAGAGSIATSDGIVDDGALDLAATTQQVALTTLAGTGNAVLGADGLVLTKAADTFAGTISGPGALVIAGGTERLTGANTYRGGTVVSHAVLSVANDAAMGAASGGLTLSNGTLETPQGLVSARRVTLIGQGTINTEKHGVTLSGTVGGTGGLVVAGGGMLTLAGANTYSGGTTIKDDTTLGAASDAALGAAGSPVLVEDGKLEALASFTSDRPITVEAGGEIDSNGHDLTLNGTVSLPDAKAEGVAFTDTARIVGAYSLTPDNIIVPYGSSLHGVGNVALPTLVEGDLVPGNSPGTLTFEQPLVLTDTAVYQVNVDGTGEGTGYGNHSRIVVEGANGTFSAAGTLLPITRNITGEATNTYTPPVGTMFNIVHAQGGVVGSFARLSEPATGLLNGTRFDVLYFPQDLNLYVTPGSYADLAPLGVGLTANEAAAGHALDAFRPAPGLRTDAAHTGVLARLYTLMPTAIRSVLNKLGATVAGDGAVAAAEDARVVVDTVTTQLDAERDAASTQRFTAWSSGLGHGFTAGGGDDGRNGFDATMSGFELGLDGHLANGFRVGIAGGHGTGDVTSNRTGGSGHLTASNVVVYGSWTAHRFFAEAQAGAVRDGLDTTRTIAEVGSSLRGSTSGWGGVGSVMGGYRLATGPVVLEPGIGFDVAQGSLGSYAESGSGLALGVHGTTVTEARNLLGVRARASFRLGDNVVLRPTARLQLASELGDVSDTVTQSLLDTSGSTFSTTTTRGGREGVLGGVGAELQLPRHIRLGVNYLADARSNDASQGVLGSVSVDW